VPAEELSTRKYAVASFFGAVHLVASRAMPQDRSLREYIAIANLLGKLIARLFEHLSARGAVNVGLVSTSLALLACHVVDENEGRDLPLARAAVGFSLGGTYHSRAAKKRKAKTLNERTSNLPLLETIEPSRDTSWRPGNCAEPEALAHLDHMQNTLRTIVAVSHMASEEVAPKRAEVLSISLTLKLAEKGESHTSPMKGKPFCKPCSTLAKKLSGVHSCPVLDMAFLGKQGV
jgi:hypothetical protein